MSNDPTASTAAPAPASGLRTGVTIGNAMDVLRVGGVVELAQLAERCGYDLVSVPESWGTESFSLLATVGAATQRLRVGTAILPIANRSPGLTAQGAATLDDATGGRFVLGLGLGHRTIAEGWHGIECYQPRLAWVRDYVGRVRAALAGEPTAGGYTLAFPAHPDVPVYLAALRDGGIRLAGEVADGALLYLQPLDRIPAILATVEEGAAKAGRSRADVDVCLSISTCVTDEPGPAFEAARTMLGWYASLPFYKDMLADMGYVAEAAALGEVWAAAAKGTPPGAPEPAVVAASHVSDAMVDSLFAIGSADHCRGRIAAARAAGIDRVVVYPFGPYTGRDEVLAGFGRTIEACAGA